MVIETESFNELEFSLICKILDSSCLNVDSEVEVFDAVIKWFNFNVEERSKFARQLLLKVRLNLLSEPALRHLKDKSSCVSMNGDCVETFSKILSTRLSHDKSIFHKKYRQCNQSKFNVLICGGRILSSKEAVRDMKELDVNNLTKVNSFATLATEKYNIEVIFVKGEIYSFGGLNIDQKLVKTVEKYSLVTKTWSYVCDLYDKRKSFSVCRFMSDVYVMGGIVNKNAIDFCYKLNTENSVFKQVARMNEARLRTASAVFDENIVVSGGLSQNDNRLNTVELYDVFADTWTPMPRMTHERFNHSLVVSKSKLFVFGGCAHKINCEFYDKISNKFIQIESPNFQSFALKPVLIENKIFVFPWFTNRVLTYDVIKNKWAKELCEATKDLICYSLVKLPLY